MADDDKAAMLDLSHPATQINGAHASSSEHSNSSGSAVCESTAIVNNIPQDMLSKLGNMSSKELDELFKSKAILESTQNRLVELKQFLVVTCRSNEALKVKNSELEKNLRDLSMNVNDMRISMQEHISNFEEKTRIKDNEVRRARDGIELKDIELSQMRTHLMNEQKKRLELERKFDSFGSAQSSHCAEKSSELKEDKDSCSEQELVIDDLIKINDFNGDKIEKLRKKIKDLKILTEKHDSIISFNEQLRTIVIRDATKIAELDCSLRETKKNLDTLLKSAKSLENKFLQLKNWVLYSNVPKLSEDEKKEPSLRTGFENRSEMDRKDDFIKNLKKVIVHKSLIMSAIYQKLEFNDKSMEKVGSLLAQFKEAINNRDLKIKELFRTVKSQSRLIKIMKRDLENSPLDKIRNLELTVAIKDISNFRNSYRKSLIREKIQLRRALIASSSRNETLVRKVKLLKSKLVKKG